jgi:prophage tail gpP-like protein
MSEPQAILKVNGAFYGGWKTVRVGLSIESVSGYFELSVTNRWPLQNEPRDIRVQDACEVLLGDVPVIVGTVDDVDIEYDAQQHSITVRGRDKTAEIIDCAAQYKTGSFDNLSLTDIATRLAQPHGVSVRATVSVGDKFKKHSITPGETIFETLELLARQRGVLLMPDNGNMQITKPGTERLNTVLKTGENILTGSVQRSRRERFSKYIVYGQTQGFDLSGGETASGPKGEAIDTAINSKRTRVIIAEGAANAKDCSTRAIWARNVAAGRSERAVYTVQGWTYDGVNVWPVNKLLPVDDTIANVHRDLLIASVAFVKDENGTITELTLALREAYDTIALPAPQDDELSRDD